eukprot:TRINITY_DN7275_c0_g1_i1.p1 TRINITY_DN7275_c0_g1~~TRINITY_DN7275_c0_g1_i1.p1  ORF type:complete len:164 (+),score=28.89 TRINITY_DN7275_c0_g1_i1:110-601(+)
MNSIEIVTAENIKIGTYCLLKGNPSIILETIVLLGGKHGHKKVSIKARNLRDGEIIEEVLSYCGYLYTFQPEKITAEVTGIDNSTVFLCNEDFYEVDYPHANEKIQTGQVWYISDVPCQEGWEYDIFTMGHNTGKGYKIMNDHSIRSDLFQQIVCLIDHFPNQ